MFFWLWGPSFVSVVAFCWCAGGGHGGLGIGVDRLVRGCCVRRWLGRGFCLIRRVFVYVRRWILGAGVYVCAGCWVFLCAMEADIREVLAWCYWVLCLLFFGVLGVSCDILIIVMYHGAEARSQSLFRFWLYAGSVREGGVVAGLRGRVCFGVARLSELVEGYEVLRGGRAFLSVLDLYGCLCPKQLFSRARILERMG